jgi:ferredoxin
VVWEREGKRERNREKEIAPLDFLMSFRIVRRLASTLNITFRSSNPDLVQKLQLPSNCTSSLLDLAHKNDIPLEGACEGSVACSTCHVILKKKDFEKLEEATEEEEDMLDLAFGLTET